MDEASAASSDAQPILNIVGTRVALGPLRRDLLPLYQRWMNDFGMVRTLAIPPQPLTMEGEIAWYDRAATSDDISFTMYTVEGWRPIGNVLLRDIDYRNQSATMAIFIGDAADRGKGHGTEATRLLLDYAFTALGLNNVMLSCYAYNLAGQRTYEKAGFHVIGRRRECHWFGGKLWDEIYMECLAAEFISPVLAQLFTPDASRPHA